MPEAVNETRTQQLAEARAFLGGKARREAILPGPGDVDQKDQGDRAGWGNLPPAQRQEALQRLTEELPSHYREVIEGYFRQLAKDRS